MGCVLPSSDYRPTRSRLRKWLLVSCAHIGSTSTIPRPGISDARDNPRRKALAWPWQPPLVSVRSQQRHQLQLPHGNGRGR